MVTGEVPRIKTCWFPFHPPLTSRERGVRTLQCVYDIKYVVAVFPLSLAPKSANTHSDNS